MQSRLFLFAFPAIFAGFTLPLFSQSAIGILTQTPPCKTSPCTPAPPPVPYTAQFKTTRIQTLANGTTITRVTTSTDARDTERRSYSSNTIQQSLPGGPLITNVHIQDPVAGTETNWNSLTKKAQVIKLPPQDQRSGCWRSESGHMTIHYPPPRSVGAARPEAGSLWFTSTTAVVQTGSPQSGVAGTTTVPLASGIVLSNSVQPPNTLPPNQAQRPQREDLGTSMIEGVEARGVRFTTTVPTGTIGNDQPIVSTTESWSAPSLGLVVRSISDNPQSGKTTKELVSLEQGEPDPALFQPPEGYEVQTEEMIPCKD